MAACKEWTQC